MLSYKNRSVPLIVALLLVMVFGIHFLSVSAANVIVELPWGQSVSEVVSPDETVDMFTFRARPNESLFLMLSSSPQQQAPSVTLQNVTTQELVASLRMSITGMCLRVLPGQDEYMLMVRQTDTTERYPFVVMTQPNPSHELNCPEESMTELSDIVTAMDQGDEVVAMGDIQSGNGGSNGGSNGGGNNGDDNGDGDDDKPIVIPPGTPPSTCDGSSTVNVNLRAQPSANANILGQVAAYTDLPILGSVATSAWVLVDSNNTLGFITGANLDLKGNCANVPVVSVGADVSTVLGTTLDLAANLDLGLANLANTNANLNVGVNGTGVNADANINANVGGTGGINVGADVGAGVGGSGVNVGANVNVGAGGTGGANVNVGANVGAGSGGVNVGADVGVGAGGSGVNVGANVGAGSGGVNVGADVNVGTGNTGLNVGADVNVGQGGIGAGVNVGDTGVGVNVGNNGVGVNVGGTGINVGSDGINIGGINIGGSGGGGFLGLGF